MVYSVLPGRAEGWGTCVDTVVTDVALALENMLFGGAGCIPARLRCPLFKFTFQDDQLNDSRWVLGCITGVGEVRVVSDSEITG